MHFDHFHIKSFQIEEQLLKAFPEKSAESSMDNSKLRKRGRHRRAASSAGALTHFTAPPQQEPCSALMAMTEIAVPKEELKCRAHK